VHIIFTIKTTDKFVKLDQFKVREDKENDDLKFKIAEAATPEKDGYPSENKELVKDRLTVLKDLRDKIINHKTGQITPLLENIRKDVNQLLL
jgi:hypothetical protein